MRLEKDFYDKYHFKVLISRPQSVFTKAFVCVNKEHEAEVLASKYGKSMHFVENGRYGEQQADGALLYDMGDIYTIDLKQIWEDFHPNISFPQFKYWYFNANSTSKDKVVVMPYVRQYIYPRQKINVEARGENLPSEKADAFVLPLENKEGERNRAKLFSPDSYRLSVPIGPCGR